ncbi:MAG: mechanosensitive ion channel family protein [Betaproteobacteria bacterium]|jgi:small conductance mechanosensitive channel
MDEHLQAIDQTKAAALDLAIRFGPKVLAAIVILAIGLIAGRWLGRLLAGALEKFELEPPVRQLLVRVVRVLVFGLFLIMALQNLGVELLPLIAGLGVAGAGIALATQGVLSNVIAGLTIIFTKPFRVGEYISIIDVEGEVSGIALFSTTLVHVDRSRVVIPNRKIVGEVLHNYGRIRQIRNAVGVAYGTDLASAVATIREILQANPRVLKDPEPDVQVEALADSSIVIAIRPWVHVPDYNDVAGELNQAVADTFRHRGIDIPFPQRDIRLVRTPEAA